MRSAMASTSVVVLPVPGPASTSRGPDSWSTTRRWSASRSSGFASMVAGRTRRYVVCSGMALANHPPPTISGNAGPCPSPAWARSAALDPTRLAGMTDRGPLSGLLVVDLTRALAGPQASMMLGDLGARVIKVESGTGDDTRAWGPPWAGEASGHHQDSTYFMAANRNKESIVLDLKDAADSEVLADLVRRADVLLE